MSEPHVWAFRWLTLGLAGALAVVLTFEVVL